MVFRKQQKNKGKNVPRICRFYAHLIFIELTLNELKLYPKLKNRSQKIFVPTIYGSFLGCKMNWFIFLQLQLRTFLRSDHIDFCVLFALCHNCHVPRRNEEPGSGHLSIPLRSSSHVKESYVSLVEGERQRRRLVCLIIMYVWVLDSLYTDHVDNISVLNRAKQTPM